MKLNIVAASVLYRSAANTLYGTLSYLKGKDMTVKERIADAGYESVVVFENYSYDDAFLGVSEDERAVYDYFKMIEWLVKTENFTEEEAVEWIEYNTIRALPYAGDKAPIILYRLEE